MDEYIKRDGVLSKFNIDDMMNVNGTLISLQDARETISNCSKSVQYLGNPLNYCPNCGANMNRRRMESGENETEELG